MSEEVMKEMKTLAFWAIVPVLALVVLVKPTSVEAKGSAEASLRHAYRPYTVTSTWATRARINNVASWPQSRLVCVEAFRVNTSRKTHLGCLQLAFAGYNSDGQWGVEFDAPTYWLKPGQYQVVYTYQDPWGNWHHIKSMSLRVSDAIYRSG